MQNLQNLANLSKVGRTGSGLVPKAYFFDGTDDCIVSDTIIGRTGYDINVKGNVTTASDGSGSYISINGNRDNSSTGTVAELGPVTTPAYTQANSFTIKARFKFSAFPTSASSGIFGSAQDGAIALSTTQLVYGLRGSSTVSGTASVAINTLYDGYLVYDATSSKMYFYLGTAGGASSLINAGGTSGPATFTMDARYVGDSAYLSGNVTSCNKQVYHACTRNRALSQAEIDADIALGNTAKSDPTIVAYYIPENLQYNTQYLSDPKDLGNASRGKTGATITTDFSVAPDGTTTADKVVFGAATHRLVSKTVTALTGSQLASKTFIMKAFVKCASGTQTFRFRLDHSGVDTNQYSSDFTATTTRQEFTFTRTLTSSSSGTGLFVCVANDAAGTAQTIEVWNVRLFLVNETLWDESPNIGGFLGRKTNKVFSCRVIPRADAIDDGNSQCLMSGPWMYTQIRTSTNIARIRRSDGIQARESTYTLGSGFRSRVHIQGVFYWTGSVWASKLYINGTLQATTLGTVRPPTVSQNTVLWLGRSSSTYLSGIIRDPSIYTFTGSFADSDALAISQGKGPASASVYEWRGPKPSERGLTALALGGTTKTGTLTGGVTRVNRPST